jgi:bacillithiol biosynthesis cysteine-adding enzyme BshC
MRVQTIPYARLARRYARFFLAWTGGDPRAAGLLAAGPFDRDSIRAAAARAGANVPRAAVAGALAERHRAMGSPPAVLDSIAALRDGACCVVAGQQPLLAGGPLFVAAKALTVVALARETEATLGVRCVPLFWNHSDDHDLAEIDALDVLDGGGVLWTLRAGLAGGRRAVRDVADAERMERLRRELEARLPATAHAPAVREMIGATFDPGPAAWFTRMLTRWFGESGLVVFEPRWLAREAAPLLARALESPGLVAKAVEEGGRDLAAAGFPQPLSDSGTGLFLHADGERSRLDAAGDGLTARGARWTPRALLDRLAAQPDALSAGVALRPVVQDALLPSVATVAGPNEAAYLAQLGPLYARLGGPRAPVVPRAGMTVVSPEIARELAAFGVGIETVLRGESFAPPLPGDLVTPFAEARRDLEAALARLREATSELGPGATRNFEKTRDRVLESIDLYAGRVAEASSRAPGGAPGREALLRAHLTPGGRLQEQSLAGLWFLNRLGPDLFDRLGAALDVRAEGHQVVIVEGGA